MIPSLNLKLSVLNDVIKAGILLELDSMAFMRLSLEAHKDLNVTVSSPTLEKRALDGGYWVDPAPTAETLVTIVSSTATEYASTSAEAASATAASIEKPCTEAEMPMTSSTMTSISGTNTTDSPAAPAPTGPAQNGTHVSVSQSGVSFGGCFEIGAGLDINVGADAGLPKIFNLGVRRNLLRKRLQIFKVHFAF